jgi:hypothetical protein
MTQIATTANNSYFKALATGTAGVGSTLTADGSAGIVEIEEALRSFWDNYRVSPDMILVNAQELNNINKKVVANGGAPLFRFNLDGKESKTNVAAGSVVGFYLNKYTMGGGQLLEVMLHPNVPPGTMIFWSRQKPYSISNIGNVVEMHYRRDYYQIEWPLRTRKYEFGVYTDSTFVNYFPPAFGMITNIANG